MEKLFKNCSPAPSHSILGRTSGGPGTKTKIASMQSNLISDNHSFSLLDGIAEWEPTHPRNGCFLSLVSITEKMCCIEVLSGPCGCLVPQQTNNDNFGFLFGIYVYGTKGSVACLRVYESEAQRRAQYTKQPNADPTLGEETRSPLSSLSSSSSHGHALTRG